MSGQAHPGQSGREMAASLDEAKEHFLLRLATLCGVIAGAAMLDFADWWYVAGFVGAGFVFTAFMALLAIRRATR